MAQIPFDDCQGCVNTLVCAEDGYTEKWTTPKGEHCKYMVKQKTVYFGKNPRKLRNDIMTDETKPTFEGNKVQQSTRDHDKDSLQFPSIEKQREPLK